MAGNRRKLIRSGKEQSMSKNSTERKEERRSTDGKIATEDLSSVLTTGIENSTTPSGVGVVDDLRFVTVDLTDVNMEIFESLREGMAVILQSGKRIQVLTEKSILVGRVRSEDTQKVLSLLSRSPSAWISNLYHKGVAVRIETSGRVA
jgi:hypothetical protein